MKTVVCFGVRDFEIPYFKELGDKHNYNFILHSTFQTNDIVELSNGYDAIMVRGNCFIDKEAMIKLHSQGLKYILGRSVGYNHLDVVACKELGMNICNVGSYSPNAIAELALTLAMMLLRNTAYTVDRTKNKDFRIDNQMFSREVRKCTVGIIGCGHIGYTTAKLFEGLGANVIVYNRSKNKDVKYVELDELVKTSDIISIHMPYFKDVNHHFVNKDFICKMKNDAIIINTARGDLIDTVELVKALEEDRLYGAALDVLEGENDFFFKIHDDLVGIHKRMIDLFPKLLITPHVGASTDEALRNMIELSVENYNEYLSTGNCKNSLLNKV